jgi:hypothetical protein
VKALECYLNEDHEALNKEWQKRLELISAKVTTLPSVTTSYFLPDLANHVPHMEIKWDAQRIKITPQDAYHALRQGSPSIVLTIGERPGALSMNSFMLQPGEDAIIADKLYEVLKTHSA